MNNKFKRKYGPKPVEYFPANATKYKGTTPIILRSGLEVSFARYLDKHQQCIEWGSESDVVGYYDPISKKQRKYYIDFYAIMKTKSGIQKFLVEVKPYVQTIEPVLGRKSERTFKLAKDTFVTNKAKWDAANKFANANNMQFIVITDKDIRD